MEFRVLGTLEIRDRAGRLVAPPRRKQRLLLAVLLLRANTPVSTESLLDLLWPEAAPASARANLHSYVSDLRRLLHADEPADPPAYAGMPPGTGFGPGRGNWTLRSSKSWPARAGRRWSSSATPSPPSSWPRPSPDGADRCWKTCRCLRAPTRD